MLRESARLIRHEPWVLTPQGSFSGLTLSNQLALTKIGLL